MQLFVIVILGILVIFFLYILYLFIFNTSVSNLIDKPINFKETKRVVISSDKIQGMGSSHFSMSVWINVKEFNTDTEKTIYTFTDEAESAAIAYAATTISKSSAAVGECPPNNNVPSWSDQVACTTVDKNRLALIIDRKNPNLYIYIRYSTDYGIPILITNNFPLQKWTNVIVSFEYRTLDVYIDGKLILSNNNLGYYDPSGGAFVNTPFVGNTSGTKILFGGDSKSPNISITRCAYMPFVMDPVTAMQIYNMGSGVSSAPYEVDVSLIKNNTIIRNLQLV
jgi:hypothetical protein